MSTTGETQNENRNLPLNRLKAIQKIKTYLESRDWPRLQMTLILIATGLFGFLFSFALLNVGLTTPSLRYPIAALLAYGVFFVLLRLWIAYQKRSAPFEKLLENLDVPSPSNLRPPSNTSDKFDLGVGGPDFDNALFGIVFVVGILVAIAATLYVIISAPVLLAEVLLDAAIVGAVTKRMRVDSSRYWIRGAFRGTVIPFFAIAAILLLAGYAIQHYAPGADSIGDIFRERE